MSSSTPSISARSSKRNPCKYFQNHHHRVAPHSYLNLMTCMIRRSCRDYSSLLTHPLLIPSYFALGSIFIFIAQANFSSGPVPRLRGEDPTAAATQDSDESSVETATQPGFVSAIKGYVEASGGSTIFLFQVSRLVVVLALLCLAIYNFLQEEGQQRVSPSSAVGALIKHWGKMSKGKHYCGGSLTEREWLDLTLCLSYVRHLYFSSLKLAFSLES